MWADKPVTLTEMSLLFLVLPAESRDNISNRPRRLSSKSFPIHHSYNNLPIKASWNVPRGSSTYSLPRAVTCFRATSDAVEHKMILHLPEIEMTPRLSPQFIQYTDLPIYSSKIQFNILFQLVPICDRLCGLVVRVLGYRSGGPGSIPGTTRKKKVVGL
jgi:hypothetical protein